MSAVVREENGMHPLPVASVTALRQLFANAIDAIDQGLIRDAGDCGLVAYAVKSVVMGSSNVPTDDENDIQGANQDFENGTLLDLEEESAIPLMTQLFGFDWKRHGRNYSSFRNGMRKDGRKFIRRAKAAS